MEVKACNIKKERKKNLEGKERMMSLTLSNISDLFFSFNSNALRYLKIKNVLQRNYSLFCSL